MQIRALTTRGLYHKAFYGRNYFRSAIS